MKLIMLLSMMISIAYAYADNSVMYDTRYEGRIFKGENALANCSSNLARVRKVMEDREILLIDWGCTKFREELYQESYIYRVSSSLSSIESEEVKLGSSESCLDAKGQASKNLEKFGQQIVNIYCEKSTLIIDAFDKRESSFKGIEFNIGHDDLNACEADIFHINLMLLVDPKLDSAIQSCIERKDYRGNESKFYPFIYVVLPAWHHVKKIAGERFKTLEECKAIQNEMNIVDNFKKANLPLIDQRCASYGEEFQLQIIFAESVSTYNYQTHRGVAKNSLAECRESIERYKIILEQDEKTYLYGMCHKSPTLFTPSIHYSKK